MNTFNMIIRKSIAWIGAMITLTVLLVLMSEASYATEYPIEIKFDDVKGETTYDLYHIGTFGDNGEFAFVDNELADLLGEAPNYKIEPGGREKWEKDWMDAALNAKMEVANTVPASDNKYFVQSVTTAEKTFTFDGTFEEGFYLIVGSSVKTKDPDTGDITFCWPMPMYIRVLNGKAAYSLKPEYGYATTLSVMKKWEDEGHEDVRPESILIDIMHNGELKETVELPREDDQGNKVWEYSWETEQGEKDPTGWVIKEQRTPEIKSNYSVEYSGYTKIPGSFRYTITNTYDRKSLEIVKTMKDYINNRDESLQDFVFEISGYEHVGDEEPVFHIYKGLSFGINSPAQDTALIDEIPAYVQHIIVKETYSGNYKPEGDTTVEAVKEDGVYKAEFTNIIRNPDNPPSYNTGVINKFSITGDGQFSFRGTDKDPKQEVQ